MTIDMVEVACAMSRALDRGVTRCLTANDAERRRAAAVGMAVFVAVHLRPEIVRYRSRLIDVDRHVVDAGRLVA